MIGATLSGVVGALAFLPALGAGRIADDYVLAQTVRAVRAHPLSAFVRNDLGQAGPAGHFYRPVWVLWNLLVSRVSSGAAFAHGANLLLYAVVCAEVCVLASRLLGSATGGALAGVLFALDPVHAESVAWISGDTDLLATAFVLGAVLAALGGRRGRSGRREPAGWLRLGGVALLAALGMLSKEEAVATPVLLGLVWLAGRLSDAAGRHEAGDVTVEGASVGAAALGVVVALVARQLVLHGIGGYGPPLGAGRALGTLASFVLAALSVPQLDLVRPPVLLVVPAVVGCGLLAGLWAAWRSRRDAFTVAVLGIGWFVVALLPVIDQPLDLNTHNGDRLLLLPSVGLVLLVAALLRLLARRAAVAAAVLAVGLASVGVACCLGGSLTWRRAGREDAGLVAELDRLAPRHAEVVALAVPVALGQAHLFPDALGAAVRASGRRDVGVLACAPVDVWRLGSGSVRFRRLARSGVFLGVARGGAAFSTSVLGGSGAALDAGCAVSVPSSARHIALGLVDEVLVAPGPGIPGRRDVFVAFDGRSFVRPGSRA